MQFAQSAFVSHFQESRLRALRNFFRAKKSKKVLKHIFVVDFLRNEHLKVFFVLKGRRYKDSPNKKKMRPDCLALPCRVVLPWGTTYIMFHVYFYTKNNKWSHS